MKLKGAFFMMQNAILLQKSTHLLDLHYITNHSYYVDLFYVL